jgi:quercetin dioxygenase-like cupin family protein
LIHAFRLFTGPDDASHVEEGELGEDPCGATAIHVEETPAHSALDWHNAPVSQYVITLSGTLEFTTRGGERFIIRPGDVLIALDDAGSGHKWRLIDDQPWRRAYVTIAPGSVPPFAATGKPAPQP